MTSIDRNGITSCGLRDTLGCIITLDSPVLPILPGRVLLLSKSARRLIAALSASAGLWAPPEALEKI
jgi:hypothetical protein